MLERHSALRDRKAQLTLCRYRRWSNRKRKSLLAHRDLANRIDPYQYLVDLFKALTLANSADDYEAFGERQLSCRKIIDAAQACYPDAWFKPQPKLN